MLRAIAADRTPAPHIAGGAASNRDLPRLTGDKDILHDVAVAVRTSAEADARTLLAASYSVEEDPALHHLVALAWAAPGKDPVFSAPLLLEWITRNACQITAADWQGVASTAPVDPVATKAALLEAVDEARSTLRALPPGPQGRLFMGTGGAALRPTPELVSGDVPADVTMLDCTVGPAVAQMAPERRGR